MEYDFGMWWANMDWFTRVYWIIVVPASLFFIIQMIMTFLGADTDADMGDVDMDIDADMGAGFQFFTLKNTTAFFTIFGWTGLACIDMGLHPMLTVFLSSLAGILMVIVLTSLFYFMSKMTEDGTLKLGNAIGKMGETYLRIPKNQEGYGKIQIKIQGSLRELQALTKDEEDIPSGTIIKVIDIINDQILLVTKNK